MEQNVKSRSRSLRVGREIALRVLYAMDVAEADCRTVWERCWEGLLHEGLPVPAAMETTEEEAPEEEAPEEEASSEDAEAPEEKSEIPEVSAEEASEAPTDAWLSLLEPESLDPKDLPDDVGSVAARLAWDWTRRLEEKGQEVDDLIGQSSKRWKMRRMAPIDRNILRIGVFELLEKQIPPRDVIYDCVELGKNYGGPKSSQFINGLLDQICRDNKISL